MVQPVPVTTTPGRRPTIYVDRPAVAVVEQALRRNLGDGPFDITAVAWVGRGRA